jgi:hypothetical protein
MRCKRFLFRNPTDKYAALILHLSNVKAAQKLCSTGLLWDAEIFDCEPYDATVRIRQCFKCYEFGHISKYCKKQQRCGHCAGAAHEQEENGCPQGQESSTKRCVNCRGKHTA